MKIGTCVHFDRIGEMPAKLAILKQNGFTTCQLVCWDMMKNLKVQLTERDLSLCKYSLSFNED